MCELKVIINQKMVFENAIYAKTIETNIFVKDVLGNSKIFKNHSITEVNIPKEQMILTPI
ncbi:MAG: CooT family nickel-binding protein [Candidatus Bathyarchaeota archaeon]|jgi:predicted RNA-binding protein